MDFSASTQRTDLADGGDLSGALRVLRFVQVSDAHILDDDAPYPARQQPLDPIPPFGAAERPQEEYTDEVLASIVARIAALHAQDPFQFVINTGDNIDNDLENELMRFIDLYEGTTTTVGPLTGLPCAPDGQSPSYDDDSQDVTDQCTSLPPGLAGERVALPAGLPWYSAFGNHDALVQGNVNPNPAFDDIAATMGRHLLTQPEYVRMHFAADPCTTPPGPTDDHGHGYGFAGGRLCDATPDNDGYYSFTLGNVLLVVLDTVNDDFVTANDHLAGNFDPHGLAGADLLGGYAEGSLDPAQAQWLRDELAANPDKLAVLFSHHTVNSMFTNLGDGPCAPGLGCLADLLQAAGYQTGEQLTRELGANPQVAAWIGGHTHRHRVEAKATDLEGFWNIESSSLIDHPQEARIVELWVTADGAKAFWLLEPFGHDFPLARELEATDPQRDAGAAGDEDDQRVLLWLDVPAGVTLEPLPLPSLRLGLMLLSPGANTTVAPGEFVNVTWALRSADGAAIPQDLAVQVRFQRDGNPLDEPAVGVERLANGTMRFTSAFAMREPGTYALRLDIAFPSEDASPLSSVATWTVAATPSSSAGSPMPGTLVVLALAAVLLRRR